MKYDTPESL